MKSNEIWTISKFKDEFSLDLFKVGKYIEQAKEKIYRIPLTEQKPRSKSEAVPFIINFSDLSKRVQKEFIDFSKLYDKRQVTILLKEIVIRLFENLDYNQAHLRVMKKLRIEIKP